MNRREFIRLMTASSLFLYIPDLIADNVVSSNQKKILVLVELKGGNDGLNTLIPYAQKQYYQYRPQLAIPESDLLKIDNAVGMHPGLQALMPLWQQGKMAWVQGVGYPNQDRSHFHSIEIWETGETDADGDDIGWVIKGLNRDGIKGIAMDTSLGPLAGRAHDSIGITAPGQFARQGQRIKELKARTNNIALQHILEVQAEIDELSDQVLAYLKQSSPPRQKFSNNRFGKDLQSVFSLITGGSPIPAYKVSLGSFDTHFNQLPRHKNLLTNLSEGLAIFADNLKDAGHWDDVLIMTYSEFGRRAHENANKGTDHGAAAPHFVLGGKVNGGLFGQYPSLINLDERGDVRFDVDFRDVYASVLQNWWKVSSGNSGTLAFV